jgi:hypothetical protein
MIELDHNALDRAIAVVGIVVGVWSILAVFFQVRALEYREKKGAEKIFKSATNAIKIPHQEFNKS